MLEVVHKYAGKRKTLSRLITILKSWAMRFDENYVIKQTYFEPSPETIVKISDLGKDKDIIKQKNT
ncbi:DUF1722 domain-containing protein [Bacillus hominis]|uniref:DUF1722 domain-containing protein n=1 Tax=Bacillus hominis TaxID=2817478 RepID=UPI001EE51DA4|nr:DUF1722 domain-containing protein [Bacillus hominis]